MTERYLGSIITASPTEPSSNLSNTTASGVWNIHDPLIFGQAGDWPDPTNVPSVGIVAGGQTDASAVTNVIEKFVPESASNVADFGDLTVARHASSSMGNDVRSIFSGGWDNYAGSSRSNVIDYITYATTGNATDFGDVAATTSDANASASNNVRGITFGGRVYSSGTIDYSIEYVTIASTGNAIDFGDLSITTGTTANKARHRQGNGMSGSSTRGLASGGYTPAALSNVIQYVTIASAGDSTDFGDMSAATDELGFMSSNTRAVIAGGSAGGGSFRNTMEYVTIATTGNVTDFGDMTASKAFLMGASSSTKGFVIGGSTASAIGTSVNTIETITFSTTGNATDFDDLSTDTRSGSANASSHAAVQNEAGFAPAAMGVFGLATGSKETSTIEYINIASTGNSAMFGDMQIRDKQEGGVSSSTRFVASGGQTGSTTLNVIDHLQYATKGKSADFGDLTVGRYDHSSASNGTRGIILGGTTGTTSDVIDYVTIASASNATDFGDLTVATKWLSSTAGTTRLLKFGGYDGSANTLDTIEYITIASTGDMTDFGDLLAAKRDHTAGANATRALVFGGNSSYNVIQYVTIASTGDATDFGDLSTTAYDGGVMTSSTRAVYVYEYDVGNASYRNSLEYVTIASTGDTTDFGDMLGAYLINGIFSASNSHGGIS